MRTRSFSELINTLKDQDSWFNREDKRLDLGAFKRPETFEDVARLHDALKNNHWIFKFTGAEAYCECRHLMPLASARRKADDDQVVLDVINAALLLDEEEMDAVNEAATALMEMRDKLKIVDHAQQLKTYTEQMQAICHFIARNEQFGRIVNENRSIHTIANKVGDLFGSDADMPEVRFVEIQPEGDIKRLIETKAVFSQSEPLVRHPTNRSVLGKPFARGMEAMKQLQKVCVDFMRNLASTTTEVIFYDSARKSHYRVSVDPFCESMNLGTIPQDWWKALKVLQRIAGNDRNRLIAFANEMGQKLPGYVGPTAIGAYYKQSFPDESHQFKAARSTYFYDSSFVVPRILFEASYYSQEVGGSEPGEKEAVAEVTFDTRWVVTTSHTRPITVEVGHLTRTERASNPAAADRAMVLQGSCQVRHIPDERLISIPGAEYNAALLVLMAKITDLLLTAEDRGELESGVRDLFDRTLTPEEVKLLLLTAEQLVLSQSRDVDCFIKPENLDSLIRLLSSCHYYCSTFSKSQGADDGGELSVLNLSEEGLRGTCCQLYQFKKEGYYEEKDGFFRQYGGMDPLDLSSLDRAIVLVQTGDKRRLAYLRPTESALASAKLLAFNEMAEIRALMLDYPLQFVELFTVSKQFWEIKQGLRENDAELSGLNTLMRKSFGYLLAGWYDIISKVRDAISRVEDGGLRQRIMKIIEHHPELSGEVTETALLPIETMSDIGRRYTAQSGSSFQEVALMDNALLDAVSGVSLSQLGKWLAKVLPLHERESTLPLLRAISQMTGTLNKMQRCQQWWSRLMNSKKNFKHEELELRWQWPDFLAVQLNVDSKMLALGLEWLALLATEDAALNGLQAEREATERELGAISKAAPRNFVQHYVILSTFIKLNYQLKLCTKIILEQLGSENPLARLLAVRLLGDLLASTRKYNLYAEYNELIAKARSVEIGQDIFLGLLVLMNFSTALDEQNELIPLPGFLATEFSRNPACLVKALEFIAKPVESEPYLEGLVCHTLEALDSESLRQQAVINNYRLAALVRWVYLSTRGQQHFLRLMLEGRPVSLEILQEVREYDENRMTNIVNQLHQAGGLVLSAEVFDPRVIHYAKLSNASLLERIVSLFEQFSQFHADAAQKFIRRLFEDHRQLLEEGGDLNHHLGIFYLLLKLGRYSNDLSIQSLETMVEQHWVKNGEDLLERYLKACPEDECRAYYYLGLEKLLQAMPLVCKNFHDKVRDHALSKMQNNLTNKNRKLFYACLLLMTGDINRPESYEELISGYLSESNDVDLYALVEQVLKSEKAMALAMPQARYGQLFILVGALTRSIQVTQNNDLAVVLMRVLSHSVSKVQQHMVRIVHEFADSRVASTLGVRLSIPPVNDPHGILGAKVK